MMRLFFPLVLLAAAIGLFVMWTDPHFESSKKLAVIAANYEDALTKSKELKQVRDQLLSKYNTFSTDDKQKLQKVLPDNVDNIRLVIDINNIAARHGLSLKGVALGNTSASSGKASASAVGLSGDPVGSVELSFSVLASYDDMLAFLHDLEHSLRLIEIEKLGFSATSQSASNNPIGTYDFSLTVRTFWLH